MELDLKQIGEKLRERREALKYTQNDISELTGVAERTIRSIENGHNTNLSNLMKVLGVMGLELTVQLKQIQHGD
jgi:transcriptional regulator with XRE-family HTH domain